MPKATFFNLPDEKRKLIIELAIEEFAEHDYAQASISRLVEQASIAKGSFYQYFEDKRDLFLYLVDLVGQEKMAMLAEHPPPNPEMGIFDYIHWLFEIGLEFQITHPQLVKVGYRALYSGSMPFRSASLERIKAAGEAFYRDLVGQGIRQGDIDPDIDKDMAVFVLSAWLNEFGNHILGKLAIDPKQLIAGKLDQAQHQRILDDVDHLMEILRFGLAPHQAHNAIQVQPILTRSNDHD
jgi:TetR/AcrR family transcriptional regulator